MNREVVLLATLFANVVPSRHGDKGRNIAIVTMLKFKRRAHLCRNDLVTLATNMRTVSLYVVRYDRSKTHVPSGESGHEEYVARPNSLAMQIVHFRKFLHESPIVLQDLQR